MSPVSRLLSPMSENVTVVTLQSSDVLIRDVWLLNNRVEFQYMFGENCAVQSAGIADVKEFGVTGAKYVNAKARIDSSSRV